MYRAKKTMPGTCRVFEPPMRTDLRRQVKLGTEMTRAFEAREFTLGYQPIVDAGSGALVAVEALLRWPHPSLGEVPPATFLPIAEKSGLILDLGRWMLREAAAQLGEWRRAGLAVALNVNVSGRQLADDRLVTDVLGVLGELGLPPRALALEVTEAGLATGAEKAGRNLHELGAAGVRVALDEFGAGASSVSVLSRHHFDQLKIDRSVLTGIADDRRCLVVARGLTEIGRRLGMQTVAVGVEDEAQLRVLRSMPCDLVQGLLTGGPAAASAIPGLAGLLAA
jgi:EAL domain-containing protein (putative c-di-GMP-specific phosphodiesterase class I)